MAVIHRTELKPTKLELLAEWLPSRSWYLGTGEPELAKAGGFRLDDPEGEVGIEFMVVTDTSRREAMAYLVPMTYRAAPLDGAESALVGTLEHGVLGKRWVYDACHDPVAVAQLCAVIRGKVQAQAQSLSDTPDLEVACSYDGDGRVLGDTVAAADDAEGTVLTAEDGPALRLHRVLLQAADGVGVCPEGAVGHLASAWEASDGTRVRGVFAEVRAEDSA
ncbi:maltokinase N-terminal cap-like domain-containing protein [Yinghuangia soli]|uniref:1,4-alpha-glucan branching protein n=1 Tax=Yinghuangia soli TaxID=2908204 RepID=A0AA41Q8X7_9ACTN|nr:1,4-alpha-glucan branching protein [Yinghuangia soli]MCF2533770.1 1,4-alpha-glucan branching protein [Yinghuangia soli]